MSGGAFEYSQYKIREIHEHIQNELDKQGKETEVEFWNKEYYEKYPEAKFNEVYRDDIQQIFKDGIEALKKAEIYAQRIDWFLSGDDGEDSLVSRLKSDLEKL